MSLRIKRDGFLGDPAEMKSNVVWYVSGEQVGGRGEGRVGMEPGMS